MEFHVTEMRCGHCESAVRAAVARVAPGAEVLIDRPAARVAVTGAEDAEAIAAAIRDEGFEARALG